MSVRRQRQDIQPSVQHFSEFIFNIITVDLRYSWPPVSKFTVRLMFIVELEVLLFNVFLPYSSLTTLW